jgi:nucleotide-binding universal stress UspA family protein
MISKILVATDGSNDALKAVTVAADLAKKCGSNLAVVHVSRDAPLSQEELRFLESEHIAGASKARLVDLRTQYKELFNPAATERSQAFQQAVGEQILAYAKSAAADAGLKEVETYLESGDAAEEILERARKLQADLIVIGCRGLGQLKGLVLGSVSQKVSSHAPCSCLTVR